MALEPTLRSFQFCDAVVPIGKGKLILYGIFTDLYAEKFPVTHPRFSILTTWTQGEGFHIQVIKMFNPSRTMQLHASPEMYFTLEDGKDTKHVQVDVNNVVFAEPGSYYFQVFLDGRLVAEHALNYHQRR